MRYCCPLQKEACAGLGFVTRGWKEAREGEAHEALIVDIEEGEVCTDNVGNLHAGKRLRTKKVENGLADY